MKKLFLLFFSLGIFSTLNGQNTTHKCGYDHAIYHLNQKYPGYQQQVNTTFDEAYRLGLKNQYKRAIHTIPVVVHIVWKTADQRLPECKIVEQIEVLNEDFRRQNIDANNLRSIFDTIAADTEIEFRLDSIIWTQSDVDFHTLGPFGGLFPDPTSLDSMKGTSPPLDPSQYLNIWMANLGDNGLLGYAYPPANLSNWPAGSSAPSQSKEGVVLHYEIVGRSNTVTFGSGPQATTIVTQGRTATHEIGHYLGLRHIWGDGVGSPFPQPSCSADDGIGDTPTCLDRSDFDCDTTKNSCNSTLPNDMPDMVENYMDYSAESCVNTFTVGQKTLMKGVLGNARAGLAIPTSKNRPTNDVVLYAQNLTISTNLACSNSYSATNTNASISIPDSSCLGGGVNDVWFSFTAISTNAELAFRNITTASGTDSTMNYELLGGSCDSLVAMSCGAANTSILTNLIPGNTYYLRAYSIDNASSQNFDICLTSIITDVDQLYQLNTNDIAIYPNPTTGDISIDISNIMDFEGFVQIKNLLGQSISNKVMVDNNNQQLQMTFGNQPNGIYLVEFVLNGKSIIKKIVLQKNKY